jgi:hypothetical protein
MIDVDQLLDEFVGRWMRDEPLAVEELLGRAGPQADELAGLIDRFLERSPRREPTADALAFVRALDDPPLLRARQVQGLKLDDLAAGLAERLGLSGGAVAKVRRYYQDLELGRLRPGGVAASVWDALTAILGRDARALVTFQPPAPAAKAMFRAMSVDVDRMVLADMQPPTDLPELDEVDRLFGVTHGGRL